MKKEHSWGCATIEGEIHTECNCNMKEINCEQCVADMAGDEAK